MTQDQGYDAPVAQLTDLAVADLQLRLDGIALPWHLLGGALDSTSPVGVVAAGAAARATPVVVVLAQDTASAATAEGTLLLSDREQTPIARLVDLEPAGAVAAPPPGSVALAGSLRPGRERESRLFADRAATPEDIGPAGGPRHALVAGRPLLSSEVTALAALEGELLVLVPVEGPTPDGVPPVTLMRSVLHVAADLGPRARVVAVPLHWRDELSDAALARALGAAYDARSTELLTGGSAWTDLLGDLRAGRTPAAVADPAVLAELARWRPPPARRGAVILFTGLSGSGKSTLARDLAAHLLERTTRTVTLLDGDDVRRMLSSGLGFDRTGRDLNVRRIGYVGSEIARHGGLAICAPIAPYASGRAAVRAMVEPLGDFVLVYVSTPLAECERRDLKGLYAKARAGLVTEFTGVSDPYDVPEDADLVVDTSQVSREGALDAVLVLLRSGGWITDDSEPTGTLPVDSLPIDSLAIGDPHHKAVLG